MTLSEKIVICYHNSKNRKHQLWCISFCNRCDYCKLSQTETEYVYYEL